MDKIDDILERLSAQQPDIDNPSELTDRILANLPERREASHRQEETTSLTYRFLTLLRVVSSIAAIWLVGLFLYVNKTVSVTQRKMDVVHYYTNTLPTGSTLKDVYTSSRQKDKRISYTQLRTKYYEKK
ncbi:MAG: hypothetical protein IKP44_01230 [Bacteroidaceae bacterium]|nr:hypothetical protein [Bacteroidaceae bacterium]